MALTSRTGIVVRVAWVVFAYTAVAISSAGHAYADEPNSASAIVTTHPIFPLKVSANNRYLVDQNDLPFFLVGDAPQTIIAKLSIAEATTFITNRRRHGINALWINLLSNDEMTCRDNTAAVNGTTPFLGADDLSTPNPAYFQRADEIVDIAAANRMVVLLDPIETTCWMNVLRTNGAAKAFAYGQFLGDRYEKAPNIIWMHGNDFQSWHNKTDDELVQAVARGIRSVDAAHIHTVELLTDASLDDPSWAPLVELDAAYTYSPAYVQVITEYNRPDFKPVFLLETNYEFENLPYTDGGSTQNMRRQEYWAMLSGAAGHVYGSAHSWRLDRDWQSKLDTAGVVELNYMKNLFAIRRWYDLVPDQSHTVVTAGYDGLAGHIGKISTFMGTFTGPARRLFNFVRQYTGFGSVTTNAYAAAARTPDGSLVVVYMPSIRPITVDMSKLAGPVNARWYDPTNGTFSDAPGSPFGNSGDRRFKPPRRNSAGVGDWVLVLEVTAAR